MEITKEMRIAEVLKFKEGAGDVLASYGAHCLGCPQTGSSTVESMAKGHDVKLEKIISELNRLPDKV